MNSGRQADGDGAEAPLEDEAVEVRQGSCGTCRGSCDICVAEEAEMDAKRPPEAKL